MWERISPEFLLASIVVMTFVVILKGRRPKAVVQKKTAKKVAEETPPEFVLPKPDFLTREQAEEFLRKEVGVAMTTYYTNYFAPAINSFVETQRLQTEIMAGLHRDQAETKKILAMFMKKMGDRGMFDS